MTALDQALRRLSPRFAPQPVPLASVALRIGALVLFVALLVPLFLRHDVFAWSIGIAYISYDTGLLVFTAFKIKDLRPAPQGVNDLVLRPTLGVIVAAHNEAAVLEATIEHLRAQSDAPDQIVIADDGSSDATAEVLARRYGLEPAPLGALSAASPNLPSLRWLRLPHGGKARALNQAIQVIETDLLLTVDADTLLEPGAIKAMRDAFAREPELVGATGVLTPFCRNGAVGRIFEWFQRHEYVRNFLSRYAWMEAKSLLLISGAFAAFRREALLEVGGFDPNCLVEDYELIHRLYRRAADTGTHWRIRVIGEARAATDAPATPMAFLRQRRRWFSGFLETHYWNRDMICNGRFGELGTAHMPVKTMDTLQPIFGLAAFFILIGFIAAGQFKISLAVLGFMLAKVLIDLTFHLWSLGIYARWTGSQDRFRLRPALLAVFLEPFTFQLLRHVGATWGWVGFLTGHRAWGARSRAPQLAAAEV